MLNLQFAEMLVNINMVDEMSTKMTVYLYINSKIANKIQTNIL